MWGKIILSVVMGVLLGCSPKEAPEGPDSAGSDTAFAGDLGLMQGQWIASPAPDVVECHAVVNGYRVMLTYRHESSEGVIRNNSVFERIDEGRNCLVMYGNRGAWPYKVERTSGVEVFTLEFFCDPCKKWHEVVFKRKKDQLVGVN